MHLPQKQTLETIKTVVIAILVTGIVAFIGGMKYQQAQTDSLRSQVNAMVSSLKR